MKNRSKYAIPMLVVLVWFLAACSHSPKFVAPEIEPPADLIPGYVPEGFELGGGYQIPGERLFPAIPVGDDIANFLRIRGFDLKSPNGNDILGVYYQGKDHLILISKSYFPKGSLDVWRAAYEASQPKPCECECAGLRLAHELFPVRLVQLQEVRTVEGTEVAILKGPMGWTTAFVRGDNLLTVESGISLEENLKIVASLLESQN